MEEYGKKEARRKLRRAKIGRWINDWGKPLFLCATTGAAWCGLKASFKANRLERELERTQKVVDNNARCQRYDRETLLDLERQQNLLLEKAFNMTEGKEADKAS